MGEGQTSAPGWRGTGGTPTVILSTLRMPGAGSVQCTLPRCQAGGTTCSQREEQTGVAALCCFPNRCFLGPKSFLGDGARGEKQAPVFCLASVAALVTLTLWCTFFLSCSPSCFPCLIGSPLRPLTGSRRGRHPALLPLSPQPLSDQVLLILARFI